MPGRVVGLRGHLAGDLRWLLVAGLVVGAGLKALVAASPVLGRLNADQAVVYLAARHVREGELTPWFWGQEYGGSLLQTALGAVFVVTGPHLWMLPLAIALVSTAVPVLTWRVGVALGHPAAGAVAGALVAVGPPTWLWFGVASDVFYSTGTALSLGALLLALRPGPLSTARAGATGLLAGLALWSSPLSLLTALPAAVVLLPALRWSPLRLLPLGAGTVLGALPLVLSALRRGSVVPPQFQGADPLGRRVESAVTGTWAAVFQRFAPESVPPWLIDRVAVAGLLVAVVAGLVAGGRALRRWDGADLRTAALLLPVVLWVPFHVRAHLPSDSPASRYALPLLPLLALWVVRWLRPRRRAVVAVVGLALYSAVGLTQATGPAGIGGPVLHDPAYARLAAVLTDRGRTAVYADYWASYRLVAETDERIVAHPPAQPRYAPYERAARTAPQTTFVVFAGQANDAVLSAAFAGDPGVERVVVDQFAVYFADGPRTPPPLGGTVDVDT